VTLTVRRLVQIWLLSLSLSLSLSHSFGVLFVLFALREVFVLQVVIRTNNSPTSAHKRHHIIALEDRHADTRMVCSPLKETISEPVSERVRHAL